MKFNIKKDELIKIINFSKKIINYKEKSFIPILLNLKLTINKEKSYAICGNGIVFGRYEIDQENINVEENGKFLINNEILSEIANKIPEQEIRFEQIESNLLEIKSISFNSKINIPNHKEMSNVNFDHENLPNFKITHRSIEEIIKKNGSCVFNNDKQTKSISGIYFTNKINPNKLTTLSTDTFKLAYLNNDIKIPIKNEISFVIQPNTLNIIKDNFKQNEEINFYIDDINKKNIIESKNIAIIENSNITDEFPVDFFLKAFNLSENTTFTLNRNELINRLELTRIVVNSEKTPALICSIESEQIKLEAFSTSLGNTKVFLNCLKMNGDKIKISFNINYLLTLIKNIDDDEINFVIESNLRPILIYGEDIEYFKELLLPIRINN